MTLVHGSAVPTGDASPLPARRAKLVLNDGSTIGFSIPAGVTDAAALADMRRFHFAIAKGHSRRIVHVDGPPGRARYRATSAGLKRINSPLPTRQWLWWAWRVALSYAEKWLTIARRATVERHLVAQQMAEIDAAIAKATTPNAGERG